jgi:tRNA threonylcarbamoyladenosine biosynthesis protein TsaE
MVQQTLTLTTRSSHETLALGEKLGQLLKGGELICLEGALGTGKTCLVQGIAKGMGIDPGRVSSPTFTIHHEYPGRLTLHHLDLYRIDQPAEIETLGLLETLDDKNGVVVIEWSEKDGGLFPEERLKIRIDREDENNRRFELQAIGPYYIGLLKWIEARLTGRQARLFDRKPST